VLARVSSFLEWDTKSANPPKDDSLSQATVNGGPLRVREMLMFSSQASDSAAFRGYAILGAQWQHILQIRQIQNEPRIDKRQ
jgi:hypothetical protein